VTVDEIDAFWAIAKFQADLLGAAGTPAAWAFGDEAEADEIVAKVLAGEKTATTAAAWAFEAEGAQLPRVGDLSIVLDARHHPRVLIRTVNVCVVPFRQVDEAHAKADGSQTLAEWQSANRRFFAADGARPFSDEMDVVLEYFTVLHPTAR
jgi:uncharacterized protein YhfF